MNVRAFDARFVLVTSTEVVAICAEAEGRKRRALGALFNLSIEQIN